VSGATEEWMRRAGQDMSMVGFAVYCCPAHVYGGRCSGAESMGSITDWLRVHGLEDVGDVWRFTYCNAAEMRRMGERG
jgi:hypothetical protein